MFFLIKRLLSDCQKCRDNLLKPEAANGKQVSIRNKQACQVHDRPGQERMQMIVVDDFSALNDPKGGAHLR
jgi:hypothetical protein